MSNIGGSQFIPLEVEGKMLVTFSIVLKGLLSIEAEVNFSVERPKGNK